jgi:hypothetical protein
VVTQAQPVSEVMGMFKMPIVFEVHYADGSVDKKTEWIEKETQIIRVPNSRRAEVSYVLFDPNSQVLKTVTMDKPWDMLKAQALRAPHMLDRYDAVVAMRDVPADKKREVLEQVYKAETFQAVKVEIATQLMGDKSSESIVRMALHDKDVLVRKGVMTNTKTIEPSLMADYEPMLQDSSYITIATALEKLCAAFPANTAKYLAETKGIQGTNGRNVQIKWLEISCSENANQAQLDQLVAFTSVSYEFVTRTNAMAALRRLNYFDSKLLANCLAASLSSNGRLAGPAAETVKYFYAQNKYRKQIADGIAKCDVSAKDKDALSKLMN